MLKPEGVGQMEWTIFLAGGGGIKGRAKGDHKKKEQEFLV